MVREANQTLCQRWIELWNGNLAHVDDIIAPTFIGHFAPMSNEPNEIHGPHGLRQAIQMTLALFSNVRVQIDVGPLVDGDLVVNRWTFCGIYKGGIPGTPPETQGKEIAFQGIDILQVEDGKIAECWISSNGLHLMHQIGAI